MHAHLYNKVMGRNVPCLPTCPLHHVIPICNWRGVSRTANRGVALPCLKPCSTPRGPYLLWLPGPPVVGLCLFIWPHLPLLPPSLFPAPKHQKICASLHGPCFLQLLWRKFLVYIQFTCLPSFSVRDVPFFFFFQFQFVLFKFISVVVTSVNNIKSVSGVEHYNVISVYTIAYSPPKV